MNNQLIAPLAAVAIAASNAMPANAETTLAFTTTPVEIQQYTVHPPYAIAVPGYGGSTMSIADTGRIVVSFVNESAVPAKLVRFTVRSGKNAEEVIDAGTFSQGAKITHGFGLEPQIGESADVEVESVTFADGTVWQR